MKQKQKKMNDPSLRYFKTKTTKKYCYKIVFEHMLATKFALLTSLKYDKFIYNLVTHMYNLS